MQAFAGSMSTNVGEDEEKRSDFAPNLKFRKSENFKISEFWKIQFLEMKIWQQPDAVDAKSAESVVPAEHRGILLRKFDT